MVGAVLKNLLLRVLLARIEVRAWVENSIAWERGNMRP
jgi:hypothetical protein